MLLSEGEIIRGTYEVERFLGEGAFAEVYRVKHRFLGRQAMKLFKTIGMSIEEAEQALGEAFILSRLDHPNIIRVFDADRTTTSRGDCCYFTMDYVAGGSLTDFWRSFGGQFVPVQVTVDLLRQICRGMAVGHSQNPPIIHRDIKPQNILVGYDGLGVRARVSDFGLAKRVHPLTLMASARGTRCFKPPEVFEDYDRDSAAGDVWALGTTLYLLLTDRLPFLASGEQCDTMTIRSFQRTLVPPSRFNFQSNAMLDAIVEKALALDVTERYRSAVDMLSDLELWQAGLNGGRQESPISTLPKSALGQLSPADAMGAQEMADKALAMARVINQLGEAADLMEQAFNRNPDLRERYEYRVKLWRRGILS